MLNKGQRLALILERLTTAPAASSRTEALTLMRLAFNEVEDSYSSAPGNPDHSDRLRPPIAEMEADLPNTPNVKRYRHTSHYTLIADNGSIVIRRFLYEVRAGKKCRIGEKTEFEKPGATGMEISIVA